MTKAPARRRTANQRNDDSPGISITVGGKSYTVRQSDVTAHDARALRQETGFSWAGLLREAEKDFDIDLLAALVWFARRLDGDSVSYDTVMDEVSYDSEMSISVEDKRVKADGEGDDSPEA